VAQNVAAPVKIKTDDRGKKGPLREGVDYPSRAQMKQLMDTATPRWRPLLIVAMFTGMRASELRGLPWSDGLPNFLPCALARVMPASKRERIRPRSNSAMPPMWSS
jgi:integrase